MALVAMLATAPGGERTRIWLQDRLWGSRGRQQAQQSLRRELTELRGLFADREAPMIDADRDRVRLDMGRILLVQEDRRSNALFLDGFDISGEEGFEEWLREERQREAALASIAPGLAALPHSVVDVRLPAPGFDGRPALAVLPFINASGRGGIDFWLDGVADELSDRLANLRWLPIIAASSMAAINHPGIEATRVRQLVGADYSLSGQLSWQDSAPSLKLRLMDGENGQQLWSDTFAIPDGVTRELLDELFAPIVSQLASQIDSRMQHKVIERQIEGLTIDERVWRARWHMKRLTRQDSEIAMSLLEEAVRERPNAADVLVALAFAQAWRVWTRRSSATDIEAFRSVAQRARDADPYDARAYLLLGIAEMWHHRLDPAEGLFREAIALNPSLANAHGHLGSNYSLGGDPERSFVSLRTALRLSPFDTEAFHQLGELALANFMLGRMAEAVENADYSLARRPAYFYAHVIKINALDAQGDARAAAEAHRRLMAVKPGFSPDDLEWLPFRDRSWVDKLKSGVWRAASH